MIGSDAHPECVDAVRLAVTEACANVVRHAYGGEPGVLVVEASRDGRTLVVDVRDAGVGMAAAPVSRGQGLGLRLIAALAQHVTIADAHPGTSVRMTFAPGAGG